MFLWVSVSAIRRDGSRRAVGVLCDWSVIAVTALDGD
jgi:hypothetical protein